MFCQRQQGDASNDDSSSESDADIEDDDDYYEMVEERFSANSLLLQCGCCFKILK